MECKSFWHEDNCVEKAGPSEDDVCSAVLSMLSWQYCFRYLMFTMENLLAGLSILKQLFLCLHLFFITR